MQGYSDKNDVKSRKISIYALISPRKIIKFSPLKTDTIVNTIIQSNTCLNPLFSLELTFLTKRLKQAFQVQPSNSTLGQLPYEIFSPNRSFFDLVKICHKEKLYLTQKFRNGDSHETVEFAPVQQRDNPKMRVWVNLHLKKMTSDQIFFPTSEMCENGVSD